jgi:hypothetical protein
MIDYLAVMFFEILFLSIFIVLVLLIIFGKPRVLTNKCRDLTMFVVSAWITGIAFMAHVWGIVFSSGFGKFISFVSTNVFPVIAVVFLTLFIIHSFRDLRLFFKSGMTY